MRSQARMRIGVLSHSHFAPSSSERSPVRVLAIGTVVVDGDTRLRQSGGGGTGDGETNRQIPTRKPSCGEALGEVPKANTPTLRFSFPLDLHKHANMEHGNVRTNTHWSHACTHERLCIYRQARIVSTGERAAENNTPPWTEPVLTRASPAAHS